MHASVRQREERSEMEEEKKRKKREARKRAKMRRGEEERPSKRGWKNKRRISHDKNYFCWRGSFAVREEISLSPLCVHACARKRMREGEDGKERDKKEKRLGERRAPEKEEISMRCDNMHL